jgi:hypothetical protein
MRVDHHGAVKTQQQGVAVGFGRRHLLGADVAGGTRPVVHHHLLAEPA